MAYDGFGSASENGSSMAEFQGCTNDLDCTTGWHCEHNTCVSD